MSIDYSRSNQGLDLDVEVIHRPLKQIDINEIDTAEVFDRPELNLREFFDDFEDWMRFNVGHEDTTVDNYRKAVRHLLWIVQYDEVMLHELDADRLEDYLLAMDQPDHADGNTDEIDGYAGGTVRLRRSGIRAFYEFLADEIDAEAFANNPADEASISSVSTDTQKAQELTGPEFMALMPDQKDALVEHVGGPTLRNTVLLRLTYQTGARVGEVVRLETDEHLDLDHDPPAVTLPGVKADDHERTNPISGNLAQRLQQYLDRQRPALSGVSEENPYVFASENGETDHLSENYANEVVREAARKAGLREEYTVDKNGNTRTVPTIHSLRASAACQMLRNRANLKEVKQFLGHSEIETTMVYLQAFQADLEKLSEYIPCRANDRRDRKVAGEPEPNEEYFIGGDASRYR